MDISILDLAPVPQGSDARSAIAAGVTLAQAAEWRQSTEAALMSAIPSLQARIELLPQGVATVLESRTGQRR